jgi:hypothetical protein
MSFSEIYQRYCIKIYDGGVNYKLWHITQKLLKRPITDQADRELSQPVFFYFLERTEGDDE